MKILTQISTKILFVLCLLAISITTEAQVLDLESTTEGALLPRMTTVQRTAIAAPSQSETVYDIDTKSFWYWEDAQWNELGANASGGVTFFECGEGISGDTLKNTLPAVRDTISMSSTEMITSEMDVVVCIDLTHTFVADLDIKLISPSSGSTIDLTTNNGGSGDDFVGTCFSMSAKTLITSVTSNDAPFTNIYEPEQSFDVLIGQAINGDWTLEVTDEAGGDEGLLNSWTLYFINNITNLSLNALIANSAITANSSDTAKGLNNDEKIDVSIDGNLKMTFEETPGGALKLRPTNSNSIFGLSAGDSLTTGSLNTLIGTFAGKNLKTGNANTFLGETAGRDNISGSNNVMIGVGAGRMSAGGNNIFIGSFAGNNETTGQKLYIDGSGTGTSNPLIYGEFNNQLLRFNGDVAVGVAGVFATGYELSVNGKIACEELLIDLVADWPDYVFSEDYKLLSLSEVESHINEYGHLPNVPSAKEIEGNGLEVGKMNKILMEKVEELTLYIIDLEKKYTSLEEKLENK